MASESEVKEVEPETDRTTLVIFASVTSIVLLIILIYPWIFGVSMACFAIGYYFLDNISDYLNKSFFTNVEIINLSSEVYKMDPLLHPEPLEKHSATTSSHLHSHPSRKNEEQNDVKQGSGAVPAACPVCDAESCPRSTASTGNHSRTTHYGKGSHDLRIDPALDKALAKFCTTIFDFYISSDWAPFETRKQLRLAFKTLLTNFGESLEVNLAEDEKGIEFFEDKVFPLCFHYLEKIWENYSSQRIKSNSKVRINERFALEKTAYLKLRRLCRQLLEKNLPSQDQKCRLWIELCVAVLGDGVLWNLILLGRNKLPTLFYEYCKKYKTTMELCASTVEPWSNPLDQNSLQLLSTQASGCVKATLYHCISSIQWFLSSYSNKLTTQSEVPNPKINLTSPTTYCEETKSPNLKFVIGNNGNGNGIGSNFLVSNVPLLVDSFLDPVHDLYQPDLISSRWRPTLDEILTERELLYCLIQYLKGHKALEYLQAVLDESPDGNAYCKKVLQLEYLPGFCRSKFFMETLGISQVDCALEAGNDSPGSKRKMGHARSSSFGNVNTGIQIWKIGDPKAVDGLPLHTTSLAAGVSSMESEFAFRRRQYSPEGIISKFIVSTGGVNDTYKKDNEIFAKVVKPPPTRRIGIDAKSYHDLAAESVLSEVILGSCDIYDCATQIAASSINRQKWIQPVLSGWTQLLRPYLKPHFGQILKSKLRDYLTIDTCVFFIDLITQAFVDNSSSSTRDLSAATTTFTASVPGRSKQEDTTDASRETDNESSAKIETSMANFGQWLLSQFLDPLEFAIALESNEDEIILFFIDLVDLIVKQVTEEN